MIATTVSLTVATMIALLGRISGAHINPAITLSHAIAGLMPRKLFLLYILTQLLAAVVSGILLYLAFQSIPSPTHFGSTKIQEGANVPVGLLLETTGTFVLSNAALIASTRFKGRAGRQALVV